MKKTIIFLLIILATFLQAQNRIPNRGNSEDRGNLQSRDRMPPPASKNACLNKAQGRACSFVGARNETKSGTCAYTPDHRFFSCRPDRQNNRKRVTSRYTREKNKSTYNDRILNVEVEEEPTKTYARKENKVIFEVTHLNSKVENSSTEALTKIYNKRIKPQYTFKNTKKINKDSFALIIGINKYKRSTNVEYADLSALAFKNLAEKTLAIPEENIITILNDEATSGQIKANIELIKELTDSRGNLYVYFAGHGVPAKDGSTYLLPSDMTADSIYLEPNLKLDTIYAKLSKAQAKNVFVFMDSCFSGKDDKGELLYKGVAPVLKTNKIVLTNSKLTIFTAGKSTDFANDFQSKKQRMFTYYLVKELANGTKNLDEIYPNIQSNVKRASLRKGIGYKQVPQIYGNKTVSLY